MMLYCRQVEKLKVTGNLCQRRNERTIDLLQVSLSFHYHTVQFRLITITASIHNVESGFFLLQYFIRNQLLAPEFKNKLDPKHKLLPKCSTVSQKIIGQNYLILFKLSKT